jgi:hypothetical protein
LDATNAESSPRLPSGKGAASRGPLLLEVLRALAMILARGPSLPAWPGKHADKVAQRALFLLLFDATHAMNGRAKEPHDQLSNVRRSNENPHFLGWSPMYHRTDSKIQVHAFYCVLALLLTSLLQRELARQGEELSVNRILEELGGIQETLIVYPRRQGQRQHTTATCLTRMSPSGAHTI